MTYAVHFADLEITPEVSELRSGTPWTQHTAALVLLHQLAVRA
jgi:hypothetical protein